MTNDPIIFDNVEYADHMIIRCKIYLSFWQRLGLLFTGKMEYEGDVYVKERTMPPYKVVSKCRTITLVDMMRGWYYRKTHKGGMVHMGDTPVKETQL